MIEEKDENIPIWKSHYSIGRSIITLEDAEDNINLEKPISLFTVAKLYKLNHIFLRDSSFSGFIQFYKNYKKLDIIGSFGIELSVCNNIEDKSEESLKTESKVTVWLKNSDSYKYAIKIYSLAATDGFYYKPRISWKSLNDIWDDNLILSVDFYNGFIARNLLENYQCIPNFGPIKPYFEYSLMGLPFDSLIEKATDEYVLNNRFEKLNVHPILYYRNENIKEYTIFRSINQRSLFNAPNLPHFCSNQFSWESYCQKSNINF